MQSNFKIKVTATLNAKPEIVWDALTNPDIVKKYLFGTELVCSWKVGEPIVFKGEWEGQTYQDKGIVLEYEPNKRLVYSYHSTWSGLPDEPENYLWVSYEIKAHDELTEISIEQSNYDEEKAEHTKGVWASIIEEMRKIVEAK